MRKLILVLALAGVVLSLLTSAATPTAPATDCASTSISGVKGNCVVRDWTVCCGGPGPGEVSCFSYTEVVFCVPIID